MDSAFTNTLPANRELNAILRLTALDVARSRGLLDEHPDDQFLRRQFVRTTTAAIEGLAHRLRLLALARADDGIAPLRYGEREIITETSYGLNDSGAIELGKRKLRTRANLLFALRVCAASFGVVIDLRADQKGYDAFLLCFDVRDRLMHPRDAAAMQVTDKEVGQAKRGITWFVERVREVWGAAPEPASEIGGTS